jgi:predicted acetyltransferase
VLRPAGALPVEALGVAVTRATLGPPEARHHRSFLQALNEFQQEGGDLDLDPAQLQDRHRFATWIAQLAVEGRTAAGRCTRDRVPHRTLWWTAGDLFLGQVRINLELNDELAEFGGHIGYQVRPTARRQGHARAMLRAALTVAAEHGISNALLTCGPENVASQQVIVVNGGVFRDVSAAGRLRYWCATS